MVAAVVAGLKTGVEEIRGRPSGFVSRLFSGTGVLVGVLLLGHAVSGRLTFALALGLAEIRH